MPAESVLRERASERWRWFGMAAVDDLDEVLERFKQAGNEFMKGDPKAV
jgi:hypothetical protein